MVETPEGRQVGGSRGRRMSLRVRAFGVWDAPITDEAEWIEVPTDLTCWSCEQRFEPGDSGAIMPNGFATHRDCLLRAILGPGWLLGPDGVGSL